MLRAQRTQKIFFIAAAAAVLGIAFASLLFFTIKQAEQELLRIAGELERGYRAGALPARISENLENTQEIDRHLEGYFAEAGNVVAVIERVEGLRAETGAVIETASVELKKKVASGISGNEKEAGDELAIRFTAEGTWQSVTHTLALVEALQYPATIESVRIDKNVEGRQVRWRGTFDLVFPTIAGTGE